MLNVWQVTIAHLRALSLFIYNNLHNNKQQRTLTIENISRNVFLQFLFSK